MKGTLVLVGLSVPRATFATRLWNAIPLVTPFPALDTGGQNLVSHESHRHQATRGTRRSHPEDTHARPGTTANLYPYIISTGQDKDKPVKGGYMAATITDE
jgi:hypothetical protein